METIHSTKVSPTNRELKIEAKTNSKILLYFILISNLIGIVRLVWSEVGTIVAVKGDRFYAGLTTVKLSGQAITLVNI